MSQRAPRHRADEIPRYDLSVSAIHSCQQHNDRTVTFEMHRDSALLGLVTTITPNQEKALYSVPHSQLPLKMGLTFKYTSGMTQFEGKLTECSIIGDVVDFSFIEI